MSAETITKTPRSTSRIAYYLALTLLVWPPIYLGAAPNSASIALVIHLLVVLGLIMLVSLFSRDNSVFIPPFWGLLLALAALGFVSWRLSMNEYQSDIWVGVFAAFGFAFIIGSTASKPDELRKGLWVLLAIGLAAAVVGLWRYGFKIESLWGRPQYPVYKGRLSGTYICPNHAAGLFVLLLPIIAYFATRKNTGAKVLGVAAFAAMFAALALTFSRGGYLCLGAEVLAAACIFAALTNRIKTNLKAPVIILLIAVSLVIGYGVFQLRRTPGEHDLTLDQRTSQASVEASFETRMRIIRDTGKMTAARPVFGFGPGTFPLVYPAFRGPRVYMLANAAHSDYLQNAAEFGIPFAILVLLLIGAVIWRSARSAAKSDSETKDLTVFLIIAAAGFAAELLIDFNLRIPANGLLFFFVLGSLAGLGSGGGKKVSIAWFKKVFCILGMIGCLMLADSIEVWFFGAIHFERAARAQERGEPGLLLTGFYNYHSLEYIRDNYDYYISVTELEFDLAVKARDIESLNRVHELSDITIRLNPFDGRALIIKARIDAILKRNQDAEREMLEAIRVEPNNAGFMDNYILFLILWQRKPEAVEWARRSCDSLPFSEAHFFLKPEKWDPEIFQAAADGFKAAYNHGERRAAVKSLMELARIALRQKDCSIPLQVEKDFGNEIKDTLNTWIIKQCN